MQTKPLPLELHCSYNLLTNLGHYFWVSIDKNMSCVLSFQSYSLLTVNNAPAGSALSSFPVVAFTVNLVTLFGSSRFLSSYS